LLSGIPWDVTAVAVQKPLAGQQREAVFGHRIPQLLEREAILGQLAQE
jgi:hypothetical protein